MLKCTGTRVRRIATRGLPGAYQLQGINQAFSFLLQVQTLQLVASCGWDILSHKGEELIKNRIIRKQPLESVILARRLRSPLCLIERKQEKK